MRRRRGYAGYGYRRRREERRSWQWPGSFLGILLLLAALVFAVRIKEIEVTGNSHYTKEQVIDLVLGGKMVQKIRRSVITRTGSRSIKSIPFIEEYKIEFKSPTKIEIVVFEKSVVGYVSYMSSYMYFDKDGIIVESSVEQLPGVPWITGLDFGHIILHQPLPVADPDTFWGDLKSDPGAVGP